MKYTLLIDSCEFWKALGKDILTAKKRVYIQTLSFEGDSVGKKLSDALYNSQAADKRILIDTYTQYVINDCFLLSPRHVFNKELHKEKRETMQLIRMLRSNGVDVQFTNPVGFLLRKFAARNHKKIIVIDNTIAYIGGINFSEHNFAWHDMMIRIEHSDVAEFLMQDFLSTWSGVNISFVRSFDSITVYTLDGKNNKKLFKPIINHMHQAKKSIFITTPYLTFPFYKELKHVTKKGVPVSLITPIYNNKKILKKYTLWESIRSSTDIYMYPKKMNHLKAMLIDEKILFVGSSNLDYLSYCCEQEIIASITDKKIIQEFKKRIFDTDRSLSQKYNSRSTGVVDYCRYILLRLFGIFLVKISR